MKLHRTTGPVGIVAGITLFAASAAAQVTDPPIVSPYGPNCGMTLSLNDTILPNGDHNLDFQIGGDPFQIAVIALGFQELNVPLGNGCNVLAEPLTLYAGLTDISGALSIPVGLPGWAVGQIFGQAAGLDNNSNIETSRGLDMLFPGQSPTVDPSSTVDHPCYYFEYLNWNYPSDGVGVVNGKVYWPSDTCDQNDGPPAQRPVVMFMHGNSMGFEDHDYLCSHLARNGYVVCSISNGGHLSGSNIGRAEQAISYLNAMHAYWGWSNRINNDVVFMGHSRGGEAAITAARLIEENPLMSHIPYDVKAVVSIAPTDGGSGGITYPKEDIDGTITPAFLGLYGSHDPDVRGERLEDVLTDEEDTVFAIYDRAGSESSSEGLLLQAANLTKSLVYVEGATHRGFMDGCNFLDGGLIGCDSHHLIARGYITAFLKWKVNNLPDYQGYFDGSSEPTAVRLEDLEIWTQLDEPLKRVVDNFEQGGLGTNTMGGTVFDFGGVAVIAEDELWQLNESAPHQTRGMRVKWSDSTGRVRWFIPDYNIPFVGSSRDVSNLGYLSLRVAQDYLDAWNTPGVDRDFSVRILSGSDQDSVPISNYGRVPYPIYFYTHPFPYPAGDYTKSAMTTIRIPLADFDVDLTDVRFIYIDFNRPGHSQGSIFMDSLQFVN